MSFDRGKTTITLINGQCFVWNSKQARFLREELRIVGTLCGSLPRAPMQNTHLGLPLQLMPEEVTLLLEKGLAEVVENTEDVITEEMKLEYKNKEKKSYKRQVELYTRERQEEIKRKLPQIIAGKKAKRNKVLDERRKNGEIIDDSEFEKEIEMTVEDVGIPTLQEASMLMEIPLACDPSTTTPVLVKWTYPKSDKEVLRYRVFRDLWDKGHYLTSGSKFGGDFIAYPGDPSRFHSLFIVVCKPHSASISGIELITMGRLGTNVKKTIVLSSVDENDKLCYTSLQWTGIS
ncbi:hypothetical protein DPMN_068948 [Dreissena polymorpha]|uniref:tRNA-splicing endonuclease subunit Sen34 n=2 Tax=Dreissena polymorpha TaxID=45954 RepID=A0A9D3YY58_DREPO|nr:hypothetical protein DPMN_068948 [Dreissena polymorpha]